MQSHLEIYERVELFRTIKNEIETLIGIVVSLKLELFSAGMQVYSSQKIIR